MVNDGDVVLALSYSGESEELLNLLPALKRFLVKIISITGNQKSSLALHGDLALNVKVPREADPFNLAPIASTTALLVMGDGGAGTGKSHTLREIGDGLTSRVVNSNYHTATPASA